MQLAQVKSSPIASIPTEKFFKVPLRIVIGLAFVKVPLKEPIAIPILDVNPEVSAVDIV